MTKECGLELVLVRHGIAVDVGSRGVRRDAERMLSELGRERTAAAARGLRAIGCEPELILTSPLRRARETAELIGAGLARAVDIVDCAGLATEAEPGEALRAIADRGGASILAVGHMPNLSDLASLLLCGRETLDLRFGKAAACSLVFEEQILPGAAALNWFLPPRILRALGRDERARDR